MDDVCPSEIVWAGATNRLCSQVFMSIRASSWALINCGPKCKHDTYSSDKTLTTAPPTHTIIFLFPFKVFFSSLLHFDGFLSFFFKRYFGFFVFIYITYNRKWWNKTSLIIYTSVESTRYWGITTIFAYKSFNICESEYVHTCTIIFMLCDLPTLLCFESLERFIWEMSLYEKSCDLFGIYNSSFSVSQ